MRVLIDVANCRVKDELLEVLVGAGHDVERGSANVSAARFDVSGCAGDPALGLDVPDPFTSPSQLRATPLS